MCTIVVSETPDHSFSLRELLQIFETYSDGVGLVVEGRLTKTLGAADADIIAVYQRLAGKPFMLHARQATHGDVSMSNAQPFDIHGGLYFAHNGALPGKQWVHPSLSDSHLLAEGLRAIRGIDKQQLKVIADTLRRHAGQKFAVVDNTGALVYGQGLDHDPDTGCLFSNTLHRYSLTDVGGTAYGFEDAFDEFDDTELIGYNPAGSIVDEALLKQLYPADLCYKGGQ